MQPMYWKYLQTFPMKDYYSGLCARAGVADVDLFTDLGILGGVHRAGDIDAGVRPGGNRKIIKQKTTTKINFYRRPTKLKCFQQRQYEKMEFIKPVFLKSQCDSAKRP